MGINFFNSQKKIKMNYIFDILTQNDLGQIQFVDTKEIYNIDDSKTKRRIGSGSE